MSQKRGPEHYGTEMRESAEQKAERIVADELRKLRWQEAQLGSRRQGDPNKLKIALRLRQETAMTLEWIAQRLQMRPGPHLPLGPVMVKSDMLGRGRQELPSKFLGPQKPSMPNHPAPSA